MNLKIGDEIFVTDQDLKGELVAFTDSEVTIECPDGFEYSFPLESVFKISADGKTESKVSKTKVETTRKEGRNTFLSSESIQLVFNAKQNYVDLHLEVLLPQSYLSYSDYEALDFQLQVVRHVIQEANRQRIRKFVLVHGVGSGKLRKEIRLMLADSYPEIEYLDASYQKFGGGATELIIHQFD